jgi:hypothetical protein
MVVKWWAMGSVELEVVVLTCVGKKRAIQCIIAIQAQGRRARCELLLRVRRKTFVV